VKIIVWGARGSVPSPGRNTLAYGGNTPCVQVIFNNGTEIILDAGTGIRELGNRVLSEKRRMDAVLLFSHYHWDHIQGLPFFTPGYIKGHLVRVFGLPGPSTEVRNILARQMEQPYFPASLDLTFPMIEFEDLPRNELDFGEAKVKFIRTNHPDPCLAFRMEEKGRSFIYFTDNELFPPAEQQTPREDMISFCRDADLLFHDSQFTKAEISGRKGWGHSTNIDSVDFAVDASVRELQLFHHEPSRSDTAVDAMLGEARNHALLRGSRISVKACIEGEEIVLR